MPQMLDVLVASGADVEQASLRGFTALHGAAYGAATCEVLRRLLELRSQLERRHGVARPRARRPRDSVGGRSGTNMCFES